MAWTTPKTWTSEPLTSEDMNTYIRDNLIILKDPATVTAETSSDHSTNSTSYVDVDSTLRLNITTEGGDVMVHFHGSVRINGVGTSYYFGLDVDGTNKGTEVQRESTTTDVENPVSFTCLLELDPGSHTIALQWKNSSSGHTTLLLSGAKFWIREVS